MFREKHLIPQGKIKSALLTVLALPIIDSFNGQQWEPLGALSMVVGSSCLVLQDQTQYWGNCQTFLAHRARSFVPFVWCQIECQLVGLVAADLASGGTCWLLSKQSSFSPPAHKFPVICFSFISKLGLFMKKYARECVQKEKKGEKEMTKCQLQSRVNVRILNVV